MKNATHVIGQRTHSKVHISSYTVFRATHQPKALKVVESGLVRSVAERLAREHQGYAGEVGNCGVFYEIQLEREVSQGNQVGGWH